MTNISAKTNSLRKAIAEATVRVSNSNTIDAVRDQRVPKGNVIEAARVAALFAVKKCSDVIPDCHPLPIEFTEVRSQLAESTIRIEVEVHTVYKTGVEVEAMYGASVAAMTMYDMLKPIDSGVQIENIRLLQKSGGKSDQHTAKWTQLRAAVLVCSDRVSSGQMSDSSGAALIEILRSYGLHTLDVVVVPDDIEAIQSQLSTFLKSGVQLIVVSGGTGLSRRDQTIEAVKPFIQREIPGIAEVMRAYGQERKQTAMLSRSIAGMWNEQLIVCMPGSEKAVRECCAAIFPQVFHVFELKPGENHS